MKHLIIVFLVKLGFNRLSIEQKLQRVLFILERLTGNPDFPVTQPPLAEVDSSRADLSEWDAKAKSGNHTDIATRDAMEKILDKKMAQLQSFVNTQANGDTLMILRAGFEVSNPRTKTGLLGPVVGFTAAPCLVAGAADLSWKGIKRTRVYAVQGSTDPTFATIQYQGETTKSRMRATGLVSGEINYFRIACISTAGVGEWTDIAGCKVL